jgi:hypothetical protein
VSPVVRVRAAEIDSRLVIEGLVPLGVLPRVLSSVQPGISYISFFVIFWTPGCGSVGGAETAEIRSHSIGQCVDSPLLSRCHRKSFLSIEIRSRTEGDGGSDGRSDCEVEGGAGGFGTGSRGRRTLGRVSVIDHRRHI